MRRRATRRRDPKALRAVLGLGTIVVVLVGGYISYNALYGLPFQQTVPVRVQLANADRLIPTDDVRIAGVRVGQVSSVTAQPGPAGVQPYALVGLSLSASVGRLPVDSTVEVRPASVLGATYVSVVLGHSRRTIPPDGILPISHSRPTVDVTDLFQIFSGRAAHQFQAATAGLATGLAGRGPAINSTFGSLASLLPQVTSISAALASRPARLPEFLNAFELAANALAPARGDLAGLVNGGAVTFGALAGQRDSLADTIADTPGAETAAKTAFRSIRPGLDGLAGIMGQLRPAADLLPAALDRANTMLGLGVTPLRTLPTLTGPLRTTLATLDTVSRLPSTGGALRTLAGLMGAINQVSTALIPPQVQCNIIPLFTQGVASYYGMMGTGVGPALSNVSIATLGDSTDSIQSAKPASNAHINNEPIENGSQCESGNEPYNRNTQDLTNPVGLTSDSTRATSPPPGVLAHAQSAGLLAGSSPER